MQTKSDLLSLAIPFALDAVPIKSMTTVPVGTRQLRTLIETFPTLLTIDMDEEEATAVLVQAGYFV